MGSKEVQHDTRYLEKHQGLWRVVVAAPRPSKGRLKRSLGTASLREAQRLRWPVVAELKAELVGKAPAHVDEAEAWKAALAAGDGGPDDPTPHLLHDHLDAIRGDPIATEADHDGNRVYLYSPEREQRAVEFADRAYGRATPVDTYWEAYLASLAISERTKGVHRRALIRLQEWCRQTSTPFTIQALTRKAAIRFVDDLPIKEATPRYLTLLVGKLSLYWRWMIHREQTETDPWQGLKLAKPKTPHNELERPFTDREVHRLLTGGAPRGMLDLMMVGALTGARLDAILSLRVEDCRDGVFTFKPQKSETKPRRVPVHSTLLGMVRARCAEDGRMAGKASTDLLFPHLKDASNAFGDYRRKVGVDERVQGNRRSRVNFHSFRRWWITKAEQAGVQENLIGAVVGHRRPGLSLGLYSSGPSLDQLRQAVEAVRLPL
jgi:site-specific recombinase XerD